MIKIIDSIHIEDRQGDKNCMKFKDFLVLKNDVAVT